jgi:NhaA family Na+:H+ antiporter
MISKSGSYFSRWLAVGGALAALAVVLAAVAALVSPGLWHGLLRDQILRVSLGGWELGKPAAEWVNQVLMGAVLLAAGLEFKRAFVEEEFAGPDRLRLPLLAALGGMAGSVAARVALAGADSGLVACLGMDMTLGLAVLYLLGDRVPGALKWFFVGVGIFTLMFSAVAAAVAQGGLPEWPVSALAAGCLVLFVLFSFGRVESVSMYLLVGAVLWVSLARTAGLAVLAGPLTALFIPVRNRAGAPLPDLERDLLPAVCCVAVPLLALVNAGTAEISWGALATSGVWAELPALFPAKALGLFALCWVGTRAGLCTLPPGVGWKELFGAALLSGAGFTVNVFLGLAVLGSDGPQLNEVRIAAMAATVCSLASGYLVLRYALTRRRNKVIQRV